MDNGIVVLGPEDEGETVVRLQLTINATPYPDSVGIIYAILSYTKVRTGTSEELDARLYELKPENEICHVSQINDGNILMDEICFLEMIRIDNNGAGEEIDVEPYFNAVSK